MKKKKRRSRRHDHLQLRRSRRDLTVRSIVELRHESVNEEARTVEAVIATENPVDVYDFRSGRVVHERLLMSGMQVRGGRMVLLESHDRSTLGTVLGSVSNIRIEDDGQAVATLSFASDLDAPERAWALVRQGHVTDVSVGYRVDAHEMVQPGETRDIEGRSFTSGARATRIVTRWTPREASLVPIGADAAAQLRHDDQEFDDMNEHDDQIHEGRNEEAPATRAAASDTATAAPPAPPAPPANSSGATDEIARRAAEQALERERERVRSIRELGGGDVSTELVNRAIDEGMTVEQAATAFVGDLRGRRGEAVAPAGHVRSRENDLTRDSLVANLVMRSTGNHRRIPVANAETASDRERQQERLAETSDRYRDLSLLDIARESIRLMGGDAPHGRTDVVHMALRMSQAAGILELTGQRAMSSTTSLSGIFTTAFNAGLIAAFEEAPDFTLGWCNEADHPDFRSNERIRLGAGSSLKKHARGGNAEHADRDDATESYKLARYARQVVIDEQDIIDDRFSALADWPMELGRAAARLRPDLVAVILLANAALDQDSVTLFHTSSHGANSITTALSGTSIAAGLAAMMKQKDNDATTLLNVRGRHLIVPPDLMFLGRQLIESSTVIGVVTSDDKGSMNPIQGENLMLHSDARLGAGGVVDPSDGTTTYTGSATNWFLAADPATAPTIEVGYLRGRGRRPVVRSSVLTEGRWGIAYDVNHDIGAKALAYQGLFKSTGAG